MAEFSMFLYVRLYHVPSGDALCRIDAILVGSRPSDVKTTSQKSCPVNALQVVDSIFEPCFKVQLGYCIQKALIIVTWALNLFCGQTTSISP